MTIKELIPSSPLATFEKDEQELLKDIIVKLKDFLTENKEYSAISAPQLGIFKRIFCIRFDDQLKIFINPVITHKSKDMSVKFEKNLLIDGDIAIIRSEEISAAYYTEDLKYEENKFMGQAASVFLQMYEMLDGIYPGKAGEILSSIFDEAEDNALEITKLTADDLPTLIDAVHTGGGLVEKDFEFLGESDEVSENRIKEICGILSYQGTLCKFLLDCILRDKNLDFYKQAVELNVADKSVYGDLVMVDQKGAVRVANMKQLENASKRKQSQANMKAFVAKKH